MKRILALFLLMCTMLCLVSCGKADEKETTEQETTAVQLEAEITQDNSDASEKAIKIGFIAGSKSYNPVVNAAVLAMNKVNNSDGMNFDIRVEIKADSTAAAEGAYNTLTEWGMQILIEDASAEVSDYLAEKTYTDRIFHIALHDTPGAGSFRDNRFKMNNEDATVASEIADYINAKHPQSAVAVIFDADSQDLKAVSDELSVKLKLAYKGSFNSKKAWDFTQQTVASLESGADILILLADELPSSLIIEQAEAMGYKPLLIGVKENSKILSAEGFNKKALGEMIFMTDFSVKADNGRTEAFVSEYKKYCDEKPDKDAAYAYDSVIALSALIERAEIKREGTGAEKICRKLVSAMPDFVFDGVTGEGMRWDRRGEISRISNIVKITGK